MTNNTGDGYLISVEFESAAHYRKAYDAIEYVLAELGEIGFLSGREGPAWMPIDTAPRDGTRILVSIPYSGTPNCSVVAWGGRQPAWREGSSLGRKQYPAPTHWMPLPEPPR